MMSLVSVTGSSISPVRRAHPHLVAGVDVRAAAASSTCISARCSRPPRISSGALCIHEFSDRNSRIPISRDRVAVGPRAPRSAPRLRARSRGDAAAPAPCGARRPCPARRRPRLSASTTPCGCSRRQPAKLSPPRRSPNRSPPVRHRITASTTCAASARSPKRPNAFRMTAIAVKHRGAPPEPARQFVDDLPLRAGLAGRGDDRLGGLPERRGLQRLERQAGSRRARTWSRRAARSRSARWSR